MREVKQVVLLDYAVGKKTIWWVVPIVDVGLLVINAFYADLGWLIFGVVIGLATGGLLTPFLAVQQHGLEGLLALLPVKRRSVVCGHYLYGLSLILGLAVNSLMLMLLMSGWHLTSGGLRADFRLAAELVSVLGLILAVEYPILLKWGLNRAPLAVYGSSVSIFFLLGIFIPATARGLGVPLPWLVGATTVCLVVLVLGSIVLSLHWYQKREI